MPVQERMSELDFLDVDWIGGGEFMAGQKQALWCRIQVKNRVKEV